MPVKKTTSKKTKTAKPKKIVAKKKRPVSAAKKTTKKPAKKATRKKKSVAAKKRTKAVKKAEAVVSREFTPATHSSVLHQKQSPLHGRKAPSAPNPALEIVRKFSFPAALSQVRNLAVDDMPVPPQSEDPVQYIQAEQTPERRLSPYVLDLKRGLTIVHSQKPVAKSEKKEPVLQQPFDLFADTPTTFGQRMTSRLRSFASPFLRQKQINFAPLDHKYLPGTQVRRQWSIWRIRLGALLRPFSLPFERAQDRRRQRAFSLHSGYAQRTIKPIMKTTRSGGPIAVRHISATISQMRQKRAVSAVQSITNLSSILPKRTRVPLFAQLSLSKAVVPFAIVGLLISSPFVISSVGDALNQAQGEVLGATNTAVRSLQQAGVNARSLDFQSASEKFGEAGQAFQAAGALVKNQYGKTAAVLSVMPVIGKKLDTAQGLLDAGGKLSSAADLLAQGFASFTDPNHFLHDQAPTYKLEYLFVRLKEAQPDIAKAASILSGIDPEVLPEDMRGDVEQLQQSFPLVKGQFDQLNNLSDALLAFLGHDSMQRNLILFQNNTELRPTGGFIGSLALVDIDRGEIENIEIPGGGPYDFQGSLFENIKAPRALQLINPRLELQDANWFFDWPTSAQKVMSLYEKAGGPSVDSVIAINTNVLAALLDFTGPVYLESYDKEITPENFREVLQTNVEFEYDKQLNQPKKIIGDLTPVLLGKIKELEPGRYLELAGVLSNLLSQRDILIYDTNEDVQASFASYGWSGEVVDTESDYLAVVHTNLAGGKTDGVIHDTFNLSVHIGDDGMLKHTLTIEREHTGVKGEPLIGVRNVDYLRVYVPLGSRLISAEGFETPPSDLFELPGINWKEDPDLAASEQAYQKHESGAEVYTESGKTVFADWLQVDPGKTGRATIVYETPRLIQDIDFPSKDPSWTDWILGGDGETKLIRPYQIYWQKQPGAWDPELDLTINYPQQWQVHTPDDYVAQSGAGSWKTAALMKGDALFSFLFY